MCMGMEWGNRVQITLGTDIFGQTFKITHLAMQFHVMGCSSAEKGLKGIQGVELITQALGRAK